MKFRQYLSSIKAILEQSNPKKFVIGNSSADYDSIFGSLIYAFFLSAQMGQIYLPLIDCNKTDIPLRFDVNHVMKKLSIDHQTLLYTSDINYLDKENTFCLYDHNHRNQIKIEQIVDHHAYNVDQFSPSLQNRLIYPTGSSLTLLYYMLNPKLLDLQQIKFQQALKPYFNRHVSKDTESDPLIEEIIRHGVLIDCFCFDQSQSQRWIQADKFLVSSIQKNHKFDLTYDDLCELKFDDEMNLALTLQEHLRRDHKAYEYNKIGKVQYSIICLDADLFLQSYGQKIIQKFSWSQYQCYMIMFIWIKSPKTNTKEAQFGREAIFSISPQMQEERRVQVLESIETIFKSLGMVENLSFQNWNRWNDPSSTVSRKKIDKYFRLGPKQEL